MRSPQRERVRNPAFFPRRLAAVVFGGLVLTAGARAADLGGERSIEIGVTDRRGPVEELLVGDLEVRAEESDGERAVAIRDLTAAGDDWEIVVLFDLAFSDPATVRGTAAAISRHTDRLVERGEVTLLTLDDGIDVRSPATRQAAVLREALSWIELQAEGRDLQNKLRSAALDSGSESAGAATTPVAERMREERSALLGLLDAAALWLAEQAPTGRPRLLLWGTSGVELQVQDFYRQLAGAEPFDDSDGRSPAAAFESLSELLVADGWWVWTLRLDEVLPASLEELGSAAPDETTLEGTLPPEQRRAESLIDSDRLGDRLSARRERLLESPRRTEPWSALATRSGGADVETLDDFTRAIDRMANRWSVELDEPLAAGTPLQVNLSDSGRRRLKRAELVGPAAAPGLRPAFVGDLRLRRFLDGEVDTGSLGFSAVVQPRGEGGQLLVQLEAEAADRPASALAVAAAIDGSGAPAIVHASFDLPSDPGAEVRSLFSLDLEGLDWRSAQDDGQLIVALEDRATGRWGIEVATVLEAPAVEEAEELSLYLPAPKAVQLLAPSKPLVAGRTRFQTVLSDRSIDTVEFYLDGRKFATIEEPPFSATAELGRLPELRELEVVALSRGREVGRDRLRINEGSGGFQVRIVDPSVERAETLTGPVSVAAAVKAPRGLRVERVEYFWNETLIASRLSEPYVQRVLVPADDRRGFVRVVAHLEDGSTAEDVLFFNSPGSSERLDVNLVELYVVVSGRDGVPVSGLTAEDFAVVENGEEQRISTFSDAGNLPLTLGLAIDSSASMFVKLPKVRQAAAGFLGGLRADRDRAFLVGFGDEPRIYRDTTTQVDRVVRALDRLRPDGRTGIWKAIVYSLVQLQGVPGRKALVVYSDGADEDPDFSYKTTLQFARKVGVPIYVILSNNELVRTGGKSLKVAGFLDRLERMTGAVGGRVFLARVGDDMAEVYERIEEEIRSQYLLGYYSTSSLEDRWRKVEVDVPGRRGYRARTVSGVFR